MKYFNVWTYLHIIIQERAGIFQLQLFIVQRYGQTPVLVKCADFLQNSKSVGSSVVTAFKEGAILLLLQTIKARS